ncbi:DUF4832 domain-containing protein [Alistipes sp. An54]|uniref:DUF4832 domain-containing protein n=1 Tax=Alistipes sp. An54 TaxID=1965645 RepID=UPI000B38E8B9|nr:DUF4832 domain-containing protein [Alistipes sp. An54]OUN78959.1 DUF4832 domain-containing protein [Alistipes sp. An54]
MQIRHLLCPLLGALICAACGDGQRPATYSAKSDGQNVHVSMAEYEPALRNPLKGFREYFMIGTDTRRPEYPYPYGSLIKEYMPWNMLENVASDGVEKIVAYSNHRWEGVEEQNVKVIPRVFIVWLEPWHGGWAKDPDNPDDLNGWHWPSDLPGETGPYKQIPGSVGAYVESQDSLTVIQGGYFDPSFPDRVRKLVRKLGEAWDNDPRVAYVEMGIIGEWGEHHDPDLSTVFPPHDEPKHVAGRTWIPGMEKVLGDAFSEAFHNKKVMVRYAYEFKEYDFGIYWDSWAQPQEIDRGYHAMRARGDYWRTQPVGGEITWNWGDLGKYPGFEEVVADDTTRRIVIEQIRNLHCNHLGGITWADFNDPQFARNAAELQKAMGYRFVLSKASYPCRIDPGQAFQLEFEVQNTGSSPFYYDWPVEVALLDVQTREKVWGTVLDNVQISQWMPGDDWDMDLEAYRTPAETVRIESHPSLDASIPTGRYILALGILDPGCGRPTVRFANTNYYNGGYHPLGYVGVGIQEQQPALDPKDFDDLQGDTSLNYKH